MTAICIDCGRQYGTILNKAMGVWMDTCAICGGEKGCVDAFHDFRITDDQINKIISKKGGAMSRKYSKRKTLSLSNLKDLYYKTTHGVKTIDAANSVGVSYGNVVSSMRIIRKYIAMLSSGKLVKTQKKLSNNYLEAAKWAIEQDHISVSKPVEIKAEVQEQQEIEADPAGEPARLPEEQVVNRYTKLELATAVYMDNVQAFIAEEVKARVGEVIAENEALKKAMDGARLTNWTKALQEKFDN